MQTTGDPTARGVGDIDVLVDPADVSRACSSLAAAGWVIRSYGSAIPGTWAWRHVIASFNEMTFDGPSSTVDLHWRLDPTQGALPEIREPLGQAGQRGCWGTRGRYPWARRCVHTHVPPRGQGRLALAAEACRHTPTGPPPRDLDRTHALAHRACFLAGDGRSSWPATRSAGGLARAPEPISARTVARALRAQDRSVFAKYPIPGAQSLRDVRYRVIASPAPADVARAVGAAVVPANSVSDLDDRTALTTMWKWPCLLSLTG